MAFKLVKQLFPKRNQSYAGEVFLIVLKRKSAKEPMNERLESLRQLDGFYKSEEELQIAGQSYLQVGRNEDAIAVFGSTVLSYPELWKVHDDLARAYLANENKPLARKHYSKSLELNPDNQNAVRILKELSNH